MAEDGQGMSEEAMKEMLGFASFGAQNPKKRKFSGTVVAAPEGGQVLDVGSGLPSRPADLPSKPPKQHHQHHQHQHGGRGSHGGHGRQGGHRERRDTWWERYYDPTSNENPWAELEKKEGLEEKGRWLTKGHAYPRDKD